MKQADHRKDRPLTGRKRQMASLSLAFCCLLPMVLVLTLAGIWLDKHVPEITPYMALLALPLLGIAIAVLMFSGAALWLVCARWWVPRETARSFFVVPGVGWFSVISWWLFSRTYGSQDK